MMRISSYALAAALLTPSYASAACMDVPGGVIASFTGDCTPDNFKANLHSSCDLTELFPGDVSHDDGIADLCAYTATQFVEIQGTYQLDRRYFAGGGPLVDGGKWSLDSAQVARFDANLSSGTVIGFPNYAARRQYNANNGLGEGYPANMDLEASCDLNTIMCCFTNDDGTDQGFPSTTDVCHHDLANSPETNYIYKGWSAMPGEETATHCVGFTWDSDDDELLGNMMYDVSLRNTVNKGYTEGIPGAPMCGCVEHMPVVEEAACRTATKTGDTTYTFTYVEGYVIGTNTADITYSDCGGDLKTEAESKGNDVSAHLVGAGGCVEEVADYLNEHFVIGGRTSTRYLFPDPSRWGELVVGEGANFQPPHLDPSQAGAEFRALIEAGCMEADGTTTRACIIRRICGSCSADSHRDIYYKRLTPLDDISDEFLLKLFTDEWIKDNNDMEAGDFTLHSTYQDALDGTNAWSFCDYGNYDGYGFPRNCGPVGPVHNNWNSYIRRGHGYANHHGFYVEMP